MPGLTDQERSTLAEQFASKSLTGYSEQKVRHEPEKMRKQAGKQTTRKRKARNRLPLFLCPGFPDAGRVIRGHKKTSYSLIQRRWFCLHFTAEIM